MNNLPDEPQSRGADGSTQVVPSPSQRYISGMARVSASDLLHLSVAERIQLAEELWDSVAEHPEQIVLTDEQRAELERRLAELDENPEAGESWENVKTRILDSL